MQGGMAVKIEIIQNENEDYDGHHYITKENGELIERVVDEPDYDTDDDIEI